MSEIKNELDTLPMRAMLAAAFITYLSAAPEDRRKQCLDKWTAQSELQSKYTANTQVYSSSPIKQPAQTHSYTHLSSIHSLFHVSFQGCLATCAI